MTTDEPHTTPRLSALESLAAMPAARRASTLATARRLLSEALDDSRKMPAAYETLAQFGELQRTPNGYKCTDPRTLAVRARRTLQTLDQLDR